MKKLRRISGAVLFFIGLSSPIALIAQMQTPSFPLKYLSSCEIDLDADGEKDIALLVESIRQRELIILLHRPKEYLPFSYGPIATTERLACWSGHTTTGWDVESTPSTDLTTVEAYLELEQPEGASRVYYWKNGKFVETWIKD